jgi:hypothetical protein
VSLFKGLILKQRFKDKAFLTLYRNRSIKNKLAASSLPLQEHTMHIALIGATGFAYTEWLG